MSSQNPSNDEVDFVLNCSKRVLSIFQNFKYHNELCEKCIGLVERAIRLLLEIKNLSNNKLVKLIESNEYSNFNNLIFDIEFYFRKYDQRTAVQSEVKDSIQNFVLNLENSINTFQQIYEVEKSEKSKKSTSWSPSVIQKVKSIGKLINLSKDDTTTTTITTTSVNDNNESISDCKDEVLNRLIIQHELIIPMGTVNNVTKGTFIGQEVAEKYVGNISKDSVDFSKFQDEIVYISDLSRDCNNILSVNGYLERDGLWVVEEWGEYHLLDYLKNNPNLDWRIKLAIARGIANALNYIHNLNLLHYNLKSDCVYLNRDLEPKLHNFGKDSDHCVFLKSVQSLNLLAPEVKKRNEKYSFASEVYNFGIILWEIATQECQSENDFIEPNYIDGAPANYFTILKKALNEEPNDRPTMEEMFESLRELESSFNFRYQKNLATRDVPNINSMVSNSSVDSPNSPTSSTSSTSATSPTTSVSPISPASPIFPASPTTNLINEATSYITSRANSPSPSPSTSDDGCNSIPTIEIDEFVEKVDIEEAFQCHENRQYTKAFKLFNEYNKQNPLSDIAKYWIGLYYFKGYYKLPKKSGPNQFIKLSLKYFGEAAKLNHPDSQYYYSRILLNYPSTTDCEENRFQIALEFLKKASDQNHLASMKWLSKIMLKGEFGCKKDIEASKILVDRSKKLSKVAMEKRKERVNQRKPRTISNTSISSNTSTSSTSSSSSTTSRPLVASKRNSAVFRDTTISNQASKRNSTVIKDTTVSNQASKRNSVVFRDTTVSNQASKRNSAVFRDTTVSNQASKRNSAVFRDTTVSNQASKRNSAVFRDTTVSNQASKRNSAVIKDTTVSNQASKRNSTVIRDSTVSNKASKRNSTVIKDTIVKTRITKNNFNRHSTIF